MELFLDNTLSCNIPNYNNRESMWHYVTVGGLRRDDKMHGMWQHQKVSYSNKLPFP